MKIKTAKYEESNKKFRKFDAKIMKLLSAAYTLDLK